MTNTIFNYIFETFLALLYIPSGFLQNFMPKTFNTYSNNQKNIIFLHGWFTQYPIYYPFLHNLSKLKFRIHLPNLGWYIEDIETTTNKLHQYIQKHQLKNIIIIGHSLGGIIALNYQKKYPEIIDTVITIASPINGCPLAETFFLKNLAPATKLTPNNIFLQKLIPNKYTTNIINFRSKYDEIVPINFSQLKKIQNIQINVLGHISIMFSSQTLNHIKDIIN